MAGGRERVKGREGERETEGKQGMRAANSGILVSH